MRPSSFFITLAAAAMLMTAGCARKTPSYLTLDQANQKFVHICRHTYKLDVTVRQAGHTTWVYLPQTTNLFTFKVKEEPPKPTDKPETKQIIRFVDGYFKGRDIVVRYDIGGEKVYPKNSGYVPDYSKNYKIAQRHLSLALAQAYADYKPTPETGAAANGRPADIFVVIIAGIKNGIETRMTFYLGDFKRSITDAYFSDEYARRVILADPKGRKSLIGDTTGKSIDVYPISWGEFIAEQIMYRIKFKYQTSSFKPSHDATAAVLKCAAAAVDAYGFKNFDKVVLEDMTTGKTRTETRTALEQVKTNE